MTLLSVNLNKVALIRNSRETNSPSVVKAAVTSIAAGAQGITVHPRPDMRHIRPSDVYDLAELLEKPEYSGIELNIEGNPYAEEGDNGYPGFIKLVEEIRPDQCTLVPDEPNQLTSDHGWNLTDEANQLKPIIALLKQQNTRVSCFMDPDLEQITLAHQVGTDRIEFYTGPYAYYYGTPDHKKIIDAFIRAGEHADSLGIGINAGHDLNQDNLSRFCSEVPNILEVSIGHAIITDALWLGLKETVRSYRAILDSL